MSTDKYEKLRREAESLRRSIAQTSAADGTYYKGFSQRLNHYLDAVDPAIPRDGRGVALSQIFNVTKAAAGNWLSKDMPPKASTLREISSFIYEHVTAESPLSIEADLLFGGRASTATTRPTHYRIYDIISSVDAEMGGNRNLNIRATTLALKTVLDSWEVHPNDLTDEQVAVCADIVRLSMK